MKTEIYATQWKAVAGSRRARRGDAMLTKIEYIVQYKSKRGKVWRDTDYGPRPLSNAREIAKRIDRNYETRVIKRTTVTTITEDVL